MVQGYNSEVVYYDIPTLIHYLQLYKYGMHTHQVQVTNVLDINVYNHKIASRCVSTSSKYQGIDISKN